MANKTIVDLETDLVKPYIDNKAKDIYKANGILGAKNLLPNAFSDKTIGGLAVTVDDNGVISIANGTANASGSLSSGTLNDYLPAGKYIVSLGDNTGKITNNGTFNIKGHTTDSDTIVTFVTFNYNQVNEKAFTINKDYIITEIYININSGMVFADGVVFYPMIRLASDTDPTYQPYAKTNQELTAQVTSLKEDLFNYKDRMGTVNLLQNTMLSYPSYSGVAVIVDADGVITTSNTSTGLVSITIGEVVLDGTYKISGCPAGGATDTYCLQIKEDGTYLSRYDTGSGLEYTFDKTKPCQLVLVIRSGVNANGLVFKPMITTADTPNSDYAHFVPYAKTNRQLTEDSVDWESLSEVGAVNYAPNNATTQVINGATFTVNSDKTITASGTHSNANPQSLMLYSRAASNLTVGKAYKLSNGLATSLSNCNLVLTLYDSSSTQLLEVSCPSGEVVFTVPSGTTQMQLALWFKNTAFGSGTVFKPMLAPVSYNGDYVPYAKTNKELTDSLTFRTANVSGDIGGNGCLALGLHSQCIPISAEWTSETKPSLVSWEYNFSYGGWYAACHNWDGSMLRNVTISGTVTYLDLK